MNIPLFIGLLFILQILYWLVGRRSSKEVEGVKDYFLAGKKVAFFPLMMTFLATQVGGGVILGSSDEAYKYGWQVILYPTGAALGLMLLGLGVGKKLAQFPVSTVAEIFEWSYGSKNLKKIASALSVISLFMILVAQIIASSKFLTSMGFNNTFLFMAFWAIVIVYTTQGGLKAVISTDLVQAAFFSFIFLFTTGYVMWDAPLLNMPVQTMPDVSNKLYGWLLMPLFFMVIEQDMAQRCFSGATPRIVSKAAFWAGVATLVVCIAPVYFGTLAKSLQLEIPKGGSVLMNTIIATTNPFISALVGCAVIAAIISTATSLINAISSNLSNDFLEKQSNLKISQGITALISVSAIFFAFMSDNIVDLLIQSYELSVSALFASVVMALIKKKGSARAACLSILFGMLGFFLFRAYPIFIPKELASIMLSFLGFALGSVRRYETV